MIEPNLYTMVDNGTPYALHKFKDGETILCQQHKCGDWFTLRRPTDAEVKTFEKHGEKVRK